MKPTNILHLLITLPIVAGSAVWAVDRVHAPAAAYEQAAAEAVAARAELRGPVDLTHAFEHVAKAIRPSVVSIASTKKLELPTGFGFDPFSGLFGQDGPGLRRSMPQDDTHRSLREQGIGSGVIVSADGYILTNNHVVEGASDLKVYTCDGREHAGTIVGTDPRTDLAVIKIDAADLTPATIGDSDQLAVGQWVAAFGSPFGLQQTMSTGIVSAKGRANLHITDYDDFVQTDAAINPGNSGGPLVNLAGEIVGINSAIVSRSGGFQGIGLAIPSSLARGIMEHLMRDGKVVRGWLGVAIQDLTPELERSFGFAGRGVLIGDVTAGSPADNAGLVAGDIVTTLERREVEGVSAFRSEVARLVPDSEVHLGVHRDGKQLDLVVRIGTSPEDGKLVAGAPSVREGFGLQLADPSGDTAQRFGLRGGVDGALITSVAPDSAAEVAGLEAGDVIVEVDRVRVKDSAQAVSELRGRRESGALLRVQRDGISRFVQLPALR